MSEIPYYFETPVPKYFRETGWFESEHMFKFITWSFAKCQNVPHKEIYYGREILLAPFEFIAGRLSSPKECFLSENIFRNQINQLLSAGLLVKSTNSLTNKYTCYIWVTDRFSKNINQQNNQQITNRPPTDNHKSRRKKIRSKEDHQPYPSSSDSPNGVDDLNGLTDDFSLDLKKEEQKQEIIPGIFLSKEELDACIAIKGSIDSVKYAIDHIMRSPSRKRKITNWPNTLAKWEIKDDIKPRLKENETLGKKLEKDYANALGWRCEFHTDRKKDQKGVLFYNTASTGNSEPIFISFVDAEFKQKCESIVREKKMQKK